MGYDTTQYIAHFEVFVHHRVHILESKVFVGEILPTKFQVLTTFCNIDSQAFILSVGTRKIHDMSISLFPIFFGLELFFNVFGAS